MSETHGIHQHHMQGDRFAAIISVVVAVLGVLLAAVTIESHRAHTAAIVHKTEANDQWAYYQAKKIRGHVTDVAITVVDALSNDATRTAGVVDKLKADSRHYAADAEALQQQAKDRDQESERSEHQALRFDLGEGFLELGLVLSSLYFLSHRKLFPVLGFSAAVLGVLLGASGFFV